MHSDTGATTAVCVIMWIKIKHKENLYYNYNNNDNTKCITRTYIPHLTSAPSIVKYVNHT